MALFARNRGWLAALALALPLAACGGPEVTVKDVLAAEGARVAAVKAALVKAADTLPASAGAVASPATPLDPKPLFDLKSLTANTMFLRVERLTDRTGAIDADFLSDYRYGSDWFDRIAEGDPAAPRDDEALAADGMALRNRIAQALTVSYVVLIRLTAFEPVAVSAKDAFSGGALSFDAFLVDLRSGAIVAGCAVAAAPDENVEFKYREGEDDAAIAKRLAANAEATMWLDGQHKLSACLAERTGGTFNLE